MAILRFITHVNYTLFTAKAYVLHVVHQWLLSTESVSQSTKLQFCITDRKVKCEELSMTKTRAIETVIHVL